MNSVEKKNITFATMNYKKISRNIFGKNDQKLPLKNFSTKSKSKIKISLLDF